MKVLVCGGRRWKDRDAVHRELSKLPKGSHVIHCDVKGAGAIAGEVAESLGFTVSVIPVDWKQHRRRAGIVCNERMLKEDPHLVLAFHENLKNGPGTTDMIRRALRAGKPVKFFEE